MGCGQSITIEIRIKKGGIGAPTDPEVLPTVMFGTYLFDKEASYAPSHSMYVMNPDPLEMIPPPHVPHTRKNEVFDLKKYQLLDRRVNKIPAKIKKGHMQKLVEFLIKPCKKDDLAKIRILYRWLTTQDMAKFKMPLQTIEKGSVVYYLIRLWKKKDNYAQLFSYMCTYAGIVCVVVHGYLKGSTYEIGDSIAANKHVLYGEWNAVLVNNVWRFINAYWGACAVGSDGNADATKYAMDETFFIPDPEQLAYTHFPDEPKWQLLDNALSLIEFQRRAFIKERFFELEMRILSHALCEIDATEGEVEITFGVEPERVSNIQLRSLLFIENDDEEWVPMENEKNTHDYICFPNENSVTIRVRFVKKGTFKLEILGKDKSKEGDFDWIAIYKVIVEEAYKGKIKAFPVCPEAGWGPGKSLEEAGYCPVSATSHMVEAEGGFLETTFQFENKEARNQKIVFKTVTTEQALDDTEFREEGFLIEKILLILFLDTVPAREFGLCFYLETTEEIDDPEELKKKRKSTDEPPKKIKVKNYTNICNYFVLVAKMSLDSKFRNVDKVRKDLVKACNEFRLGPLERMVDLVETKEYERFMMKETRHARKLIERLRAFYDMLHEVMVLDYVAISDIKKVNEPEIHSVMKSALLILGHFEEETKNWKTTQAIIGKSGKLAIKRRITEFDINELKLDIALGAKKLLGTLTIENVEELSYGASVFFKWIKVIVKEMELRYGHLISNTIPRTTKDKVENTKSTKAMLIEFKDDAIPEKEKKVEDEGFFAMEEDPYDNDDEPDYGDDDDEDFY